MSTEVHDSLAHAMRSALRPIARILLRNGVPFRTFLEYAKQAFVDVAAAEFTVPGRKSSISRIAVITGLTRKDASRLVNPPADDSASTERYNRAARVISGWVREDAFHDASGRPASLPVGGRRGFGELVRRFAGDVPARAVLDELERVSAVTRTRDGRIRLLTRGYVPRTGEEDKLAILGTDVSDLVSSIDHNLTHPAEDAFFQRKVSYDNLVGECLPGLRERTGRRAQALLEFLDRHMSQHDRDTRPRVRGSGRHRAVIGIYYYEQPVEDSP
jgi:hypothetical protein